MRACVLEDAETIDRRSHGESESTLLCEFVDDALPGVYVPQSGLTPVQELARLLGLWEGDIDDFE